MIVNVICPDCGAHNELADSSCWKCKRPITDEEKSQAENKARSDKKMKEMGLDPQIEREKQAIEEAKLIKRQEEENILKKHEKLINLARSSGNWSNVPEIAILAEINNITLTTSFFLSGKKIIKEIEIISAEVVFGMNIFRDFFAGVRDIVGGRSGATQKVLRDCRKTALEELKKEALFLGANAVISVDLDYQEISGGGKSGMMMLVASGTAVLTEDESSSPSPN